MGQNNMSFCFKGSRTYVHGTDIYNKMQEHLDEIGIVSSTIDLSIHSIAKKNIELFTIKPEDDKLLKFAYKYTDNNGNKSILYGLENDSEIECRYEYPEEDICNLSKVDIEKQEVVLDKETSFTFIENCVAINKFLLETIFHDANGKWYFTRLQLKKIPKNNIYPLKLVLKANFNFKLTKTEIYIDDKSIGFIYFSLV